MSEPMDIVSRMRLLEADHKPDGWPAVQMRDISALCNMIEKDRARVENDGVTCYEGKGGYALVDKAQWEWLHREVDRLKYFIEDYKRDAKCYETAFDEAEADVKQSVQKQMAELRAENARLKADAIKLEDSLCGAVCIIRNEAGLKMLHRNKEGENTLNRWADELIEESGMDFEVALSRVTDPDEPDDFGVIQVLAPQPALMDVSSTLP